jgi:hypothetical protein
MGMGKVKRLFQKLKGEAGYVSVETVIVAGLVIALGAYALTQFYMVGQATTEGAVDNINKVFDVNVIETPIP